MISSAAALLAGQAGADDAVYVRCADDHRCTASWPEGRKSAVLDLRGALSAVAGTIAVTDERGRPAGRAVRCADGGRGCLEVRDALEWRVSAGGRTMQIRRRSAAAPLAEPGPSLSSVPTFVDRALEPSTKRDAGAGSQKALGGAPIQRRAPGTAPRIQRGAPWQGVLPDGERFGPLSPPAPPLLEPRRALQLSGEQGDEPVSVIGLLPGGGGVTGVLAGLRPPPPPAAYRNPRERADDATFADVVLVASDRPRCTGVLVRPHLVLTAAHCAPAMEVQFGSRADEIADRARVSRSVPHPGGLDAAALILDRDVPWPTRPMRAARDRSPPLGSLAIIGFGIDDPVHHRGFGIKRRVAVNVSGWGCDARRASTTGCDPATELLVPAESGRDTCDGDSGGPILEWVGGTWRLIAITSRPTLATGSACGRGGIYVRADALGAWLESIPFKAGESQ